MRPRFDITHRRDGPAVVLAARGELDLLASPELERALADVLDEAPAAPVRLELGQLSFVDVAGVRAVWRAVQMARADGREVRVSLGSAHVRRVFELCGVREAAGGRLHSTAPL